MANRNHDANLPASPPNQGEAATDRSREDTRRPLQSAGLTPDDVIAGSIQGLAILRGAQFLYASDRFAGFFDETAEALTGRSIAPLISAHSLERLRQAEREGATRELDLEGSGHKHTGRLKLKAMLRRILWSGEPALLITAVDDTGRQRTEAEFRNRQAQLLNIVENAPVAISVKDENMRYVLVNRAFCQLIRRDEAEILGRRTPEVLAAGGEEFEIFDEQVRRERKPLGLKELIISVSGHEAHILLDKFPLTDEDDQFRGICSIIYDVTDLRVIERQLGQAQKADVLGQMSSGFLHDFNNYLAIIMGNLELASAAVDKGSRTARNLGAAASAVKKAAKLSQQLLGFIRDRPVRPDYVSAAAVALDIKAMCNRTMGSRHSVTADVPEEHWHIYVDRSKLEAALVNLAINASDAMADGGPLEIWVRNHRYDSRSVHKPNGIRPGQYVELAIKDRGKGMTEEVRARCMEPFFTTKTDRQSLGLGLSLVFRFVHEAGGTIHIESAPDRGTEVRLFFPRAPAPSPPRPKAGAPRKAPAKGKASPSEDH